MKRRTIVALSIAMVTSPLHAGTFTEFVLTDQTPMVPLADPLPTSYAPRYLSGFGLGDSFTVFFEDRNAAQAISSVATSTGPEGFPTAVTASNIADTHFVVKDWPITIGPTPYTYRAWGSVGNNPNHAFYVSNDLPRRHSRQRHLLRLDRVEHRPDDDRPQCQWRRCMGSV